MTEPNFLPAATDLVKQLQLIYTEWGGVDQFVGTPRRLAEMFTERCWSPTRIKTELEDTVRIFKDDCKEMMIAGPASVWAMCPHHLLPCELQVVIGILPRGRVLGLSKFTRIAEILGNRPIMQETYTTELAEYIQKILEPKGTAVHVTGSHTCMTSRGVKQPRTNRFMTTALRGDFLTDPSVKDEFMQSVAMRYKDI